MGTITLTVSGLVLLLFKDDNGVTDKLDEAKTLSIGVAGQDRCDHNLIFKRNDKDLLVKPNMKLRLYDAENISPPFSFQSVDEISTPKFSFDHVLSLQTFLHPDIAITYKEENCTTTLEVPRGRFFISKVSADAVFEYPDKPSKTFSAPNDEVKIEIDFQGEEKLALIIGDEEIALADGDNLIFRNHTNHESPMHFSMIYEVAQVPEAKRAKVVKRTPDHTGRGDTDYDGTMCGPIRS